MLKNKKNGDVINNIAVFICFAINLYGYKVYSDTLGLVRPAAAWLVAWLTNAFFPED